MIHDEAYWMRRAMRLTERCKALKAALRRHLGGPPVKLTVLPCRLCRADDAKLSKQQRAIHKGICAIEARRVGYRRKS